MYRLLFLFLGLFASGVHGKEFDLKSLRDGDIVFQSSKSLQSLGIRLATHSPVSHCGLVYSKDGKFYVLEASTTVRSIPFERFVKKGAGGLFAVKRLRKADSLLTAANLEKVRGEEAKFDGRPYDWYFNWDDGKIYCSELVYKVYKNSLGLELGEVKKLKDFDLTNPLVAVSLKEKYGDSIPLEDKVVAPSSIYSDTNLVEVFDDFGGSSDPAEKVGLSGVSKPAS